LAEGAFADPALDSDRCALELAQRVARKIGTQWAEIEIVFAGARAFALSIAPLHSLKEIAGMPLYGRDLAVTKWTGTDALSLAVDLLKGHAHER
jgi:F420-0:gamma-glutamyl ligase